MNNVFNKRLTKDFIENLFLKYAKIPVKINNIDKIQKAFIHKSFYNENYLNNDADNTCCTQFFDCETNERYEFLGDKVIDVIVTEYLFDMFPKKDEGFLTKLKSRIVRKESLCKLGEQLSFKEYIMISSHVEKIKGRQNKRFMEDIFEAFIGVLYKDQNSDINIIRRFLLGVIETHINIHELSVVNENYKDILMRFLHVKSLGAPSYKIVRVLNEETTVNQGFISIVYVLKEKLISNVINSEDYTIFLELDKKTRENPYIKDQEDTLLILGVGEPDNTKKISEQKAAYQVLQNLNVSKDF
jgi:dsRNA-specific ribonuclease